MIRFTQPAYLLLIIPVGYYTYWVVKNSLADLSPFRRKLAIILRSVILLFLILAISGAQAVRQAGSKCVIFALDVSESVPKSKLKSQLDYVNNAIKNSASNDKIGVIVFGKDASVELTPGFIKRVGGIQSAPKSNNTDISQALALALASFPENSAKKIALISDGNETLGSSLDQAVLAGANGVSIDTIAVSSEITKEVLLENMATPTISKIGEPFDVNIVVDSTKPTLASVRLLRNGTEVASQSAALAKGKTSIKFKQSVAKAGNYNYRAIIESSDDTLAENNIASSYTLIKGKPRLLYIEGQPGQSEYLTKALSASDIIVEARDKSGVPASMADLRAYDMLVLSDVPAWNLSPEQMEMVRTGVKDMGIGFIMIGGENSFGAGGYFDTPIEKALPVDMSIKKTRVLPTLSVVIVMDKSGSMSIPEDGREKITLANDAAASVVKLLQPIDKVGVIVCHDTPGVAVPLGPASPKGPIYDQISTIRAEGGGIMVFQSMKAAYQMIKGSGTRQKHVILLADGQDCDDQNGVIPLVSKMAKEKITVTSVAIGDGQHVPFLKAVAYTGKGSFYLARRARDIKAIFTKDVMTISKSLIVEEPFIPKLAMPGEELEGINTSAFPPLLGYVVVSPKPAGRLSLISHKKDPILASWQYGLGRSIAFTSDCKSRWSARWIVWPEYNKFWSQISRWTMRKNASDSLQSRIELKNGRGQVVIDAMDEKGNFLNMLEFNGSVIDPEVKGRSIAIEQTAPGRYEGSFEAEKLGSYVVSIAKKGAKSVSPEISVLSIPYPAEYKNILPNIDLLKQISTETGGKFNPNPSDIFNGKFKKAWSYTDLWRLLTLISIILLPLDIATRRIAFSAELIGEIYGKIVFLLNEIKNRRHLRNAKVSTQEMGALLKAKRSVKENLKSRPETSKIPDIISAANKQMELDNTPAPQQNISKGTQQNSHKEPEQNTPKEPAANAKPSENVKLSENPADSQPEDTTSRLLKAKHKAKDERK